MPQAYGKIFAKVYNKKWSDFIKKIGPSILDFYSDKTISKKNKKILDLCCGTGQLALLFLESGYYVTGIDLSEDMLYYAKENNKKYVKKSKVEFIRGNAANFSLNEKYGLVISTYDSLNHLENEKKLKSCFNSVYNVLAKEGYFVFDLNTLAGIKKNWRKTSFIDDEEMIITIKGSFNEAENKGYTNISGFVRGKDGSYERCSEVIFNKCYEMDTVKKLLRKTKFKEIYFANINDLSKPIENPEEEKRVFIIAKK
jgi:ubiquinone/menaquinone biosynthesis C-methylase UbiE